MSEVVPAEALVKGKDKKKIYIFILFLFFLNQRASINYLDGAEVHGMLDDVMVVMKAKSACING